MLVLVNVLQLIIDLVVKVWLYCLLFLHKFYNTPTVSIFRECKLIYCDCKHVKGYFITNLHEYCDL